MFGDRQLRQQTIDVMDALGFIYVLRLIQVLIQNQIDILGDLLMKPRRKLVCRVFCAM